MAYEVRCKILEWNSLEHRREFISLVECCKTVFELNGLKFNNVFELCISTKTRANHQCKSQVKSAKINSYKHFFFVRMI